MIVPDAPARSSCTRRMGREKNMLLVLRVLRWYRG